MIERRQMLGATGVAGLFGVVGTVGGDPQASDKSVEDVKGAIDDLRKAIVASRSFDGILAVREQLRGFLRVSGKFPDFIEVGMDVWFAIYDWLVVFQQPITISRDASGRYTLPLVATTVILRPDLLAGFIGAPYDLK